MHIHVLWKVVSITYCAWMIVDAGRYNDGFKNIFSYIKFESLKISQFVNMNMLNTMWMHGENDYQLYYE